MFKARFLNPSIQLATLVALLCAPLASPAQDISIDDLPPDVRASTNDVLSNALNALHVFSSSDAVSSGYLRFQEEDGTPETKADVLKLSGDYRFERCSLR